MKWMAIIAVALTLAGCNKSQPEPMTKAVDVGGQPAIALKRGKTGNGLQFLGADILPGRGMNVYQIRAFVPGKGEVNVLTAPPLAEAPTLMNGGADDMIGNKSFSVGGAILVPYANRITGDLSKDGQTVKTDMMGKVYDLPANWHGKNAGAPKYAMHGLILDAKLTDVTHDENSASAVYHAGNFGGHWPGSTDLKFNVQVEKDSFTLTVKATNLSNELVPIGIGWHPYFALPSGDRTQARLQVPARSRGIVNNYDDVLPTGKKVSVTDTPYDFSKPGGQALGKLFMDDTFIDLTKDASEATVATIADPAAKYGVRITAPGPDIHAIQIYAPPDKHFVVLEPQFNFAEPFSKIWNGAETGMQLLQPNQSVTYIVKLELFVPTP